MPGAEDIVISPKGDTALAVGGDGRSFRSGGPGRGRIGEFNSLDPSASRELIFKKQSAFEVSAPISGQAQMGHNDSSSQTGRMVNMELRSSGLRDTPVPLNSFMKLR